MTSPRNTSIQRESSNTLTKDDYECNKATDKTQANNTQYQNHTKGTAFGKLFLI